MDGEQDRDRGAHMNIVRDREKDSQKDREWMLLREREKDNERGTEINRNRCPILSCFIPLWDAGSRWTFENSSHVTNLCPGTGRSPKSKIHQTPRTTAVRARTHRTRDIAQDSRAPAHWDTKAVVLDWFCFRSRGSTGQQVATKHSAQCYMYCDMYNCIDSRIFGELVPITVITWWQPVLDVLLEAVHILWLKELVHQFFLILSLITHPHVVPNL